MDRPIDEGQLKELMAESQDLHADTLRAGKHDLADYVAAVVEQRQSRFRNRCWPVPLAIAAGATGFIAAARPGWAEDNREDGNTLQTAASLENLAVASYKAALDLPFIGGASANPVVKAFATTTMAQHAEHAQAFNNALKEMGIPEQTDVNPKYDPVIRKALPTVKNSAEAVSVAITIEDIAAQTYVKNISLVGTAKHRQLFASIAGVEAQHKAILLAVQALLGANAVDLLTVPADVAALPSAIGSVGFPDGFFSTAQASPTDEGVVQ